MTASWYAHLTNYDFTTHKPKNGKTYDQVAGLTAMIWKGNDPVKTDADADHVAFAIQAGCAAARFCKTMNASGKYPTNLKKQCIDENKVDFCLAEKIVKSVNEHRELRKDTKDVTEDKEINKEIALALKAIE